MPPGLAARGRFDSGRGSQYSGPALHSGERSRYLGSPVTEALVRKDPGQTPVPVSVCTLYLSVPGALLCIGSCPQLTLFQ